MKRLVLCCDGTWNSPDQLNSGQPAPTNVTRLALAVRPRDAAGVEQRLFYHPGVGTTRRQRIIGGAFGYGLSRDVRDCYRFLVENFEPGDSIYLFGFSRGAFTARSTAGLIRNSGILRRQHADRLNEAFALYRSRQLHPRGVEATLFRTMYSHEPRIRFVGVWDTVGALGIPLSGLRIFKIVNRRNRFHDTDLSTWVDAAFQALAIDEMRKPFRPAVWNEQASNPQGSQVLEQVWFAGVHCDVGGGYKQHGLSDIPLLWMVRKATEHQLALDIERLAAGPFAGVPNEDPSAPDPAPLGEQHETLNFWYGLLGAYHRPIDTEPAHRESASSSAVERTQLLPEYKPVKLMEYLADRSHQETRVDINRPVDRDAEAGL